MSLENSLNSFFGRRGEAQGISTPSNAEPDSPNFILSIKEVPLVRRAREKASLIVGY